MILVNKKEHRGYTYQNGFYEIIEENNKCSLYNKNGNIKYKNADSTCIVLDYFLIKDGGKTFRLDITTETFLEDINNDNNE